MTAAIASGLLLAFCVLLLVCDWVWDHFHGPMRDYDAEASHKALLRELDRIGEEAASRQRHPTGRDQ